MGVTLGSSVILNTLFVPFAPGRLSAHFMNLQTYFLWMEGSLFAHIDLNFKKVNLLPSWPTLSCLKSTGPSEVKRTKSATVIITGRDNSSITMLPIISIVRFRKKDTFLLERLRTIS